MSTTRQRAKTKRNFAYVLFAIGIGNILTRVFGLVEFDTTQASSLEEIYDMEWEYYVLPLIPLIAGIYFWMSYKSLLHDAQDEERALAKWNRPPGS